MQIICLAITILMLLSNNTVQADEGSIYENEIGFLNKQGIMQGYNDGTFKPEKEISKAEFLKIILNTLGYRQQSSIKGHWATNYINLAEKIGFIEKGDYQIKDLDKVVTKSEAKRITQTALKYKGEELTEEEKTIYNSYYGNLEEQLPYIKGILNDVIPNGLEEKSPLTRGEASLIAARIFNEDFRIRVKPIIEDNIEKEEKGGIINEKKIN